uniref:ISXO2-like transposase domain-containing protein n=1 Tax=Heliothis virescens TaxID=7102 RepID=A0A2A4JDY6_HELVI
MEPFQLLLARNFSIWNYAAAICSEERAIEAAKRWLLIPSQTPRCPSCGRPMNAETNTNYKLGFRWRCRRAGCNIIRSPLKGTFFERSNVSIRLLLHFFRRDKVSQAARDVGVTRKTAIQIYHYLREVCEVAEAHDRDMIGGDNDIVEVDETHLYTNKYHRGRLLQRQTWSFGCISRLTKKIHVELILNKNRATLDPIIQQNVRQNSYIMSDQHRAYMGVHLRLGMRGHSSVNHSQQFTAGTVNIPVDPSLGIPVPGSSNVRCKVHTNTIERQWLELKRQCRTCRSQRRLKWYMGEYMYRQNILKSLPSDEAYPKTTH